MNNREFSNFDPIKPIIYAKPIDAHYCDIHKQTFIFLQSLMNIRNRKQNIKMLLRIINFIYEHQNATKQDMLRELHISRNTLNKYIRYLKSLKLYKQQRRSILEIKNNVPKKYIFVMQPWLEEIVFFIKHHYICPIMLMPKGIQTTKLFNRTRELIIQDLHATKGKKIRTY